MDTDLILVVTRITGKVLLSQFVVGGEAKVAAYPKPNILESLVSSIIDLILKTLSTLKSSKLVGLLNSIDFFTIRILLIPIDITLLGDWRYFAKLQKRANFILFLISSSLIIILSVFKPISSTPICFLRFLVYFIALYTLKNLLFGHVAWHQMPGPYSASEIPPIWEELSEERIRRSKLLSTALYSGDIEVPRKAYVNDTHSINIQLLPTHEIPIDGTKILNEKKSKNGKTLQILIEPRYDSEQLLEIELLAAGVEISGDLKQSQLLTQRALNYHWSCYFPNSGVHRITLVFRLLQPSITLELGTVTHAVKVVKVDHLTQNQVWLLTTFFGIISGALAIAELLHRLGVW
jgi:hypothetical protein